MAADIRTLRIQSDSEYFEKIKAFPGARELLQEMKGAGLRIAIASSASKEDLERARKDSGHNRPGGERNIQR
jgi:phosphoglycolate phosphatase-like HAD superfamily hydrolase